MFNNLGWGELIVLAIIGLLVVGPERLPKLAADAGRLVRELRRMATGVTADLRAEFGADLDELRALDPRRFLDQDLATEPAEPARPEPAAALAAGEVPPYDPEAT